MHRSSKHKHKSKSNSSWSPWSHWTWNDEYRRYYRYRQDSEGAMDYEWDESRSSIEDPLTTAAATNPLTPRGDDIDGITRGIDNLYAGSGAYEPYDDAQYEVASGSHVPQSSSSKSKERDRARDKPSYSSHSHQSKSKKSTYESKEPKGSSSRSKGKSKAPSHADDEDPYAEATGSGREPVTGEEAQMTYDPETGEYYYATHYANTDAAQYDPASSAPQYTTEVDGNHAPTETPTYDDDEIIRDAIRESRRLYDTHRTASDPAYATTSTASAYTHSTYPSTSAYAPYDEPDRSATPTPNYEQQPWTSEDSMTALDPQRLDPRYRVEKSHKFAPGSIFKVYWSEPQGSSQGTNDNSSIVSGRQEMENMLGEKFFVGFRRFIVIANDQGHCTCVPILTYGGKGCKKHGVKPDKHGIVHQRGHRAKALDREPKLGFPPVRVELTDETEKLSKESRVNYSKLVTVEHNIKVFFIGHIMASDWEIVYEAVNTCWEKKTHHMRRQYAEA